MATDLTTRERVQQAVMMQFELLAEKEVAQDTVGKATSARNAVLNSTVIADASASMGAIQETTKAEAEVEYQKKIEAANKPLALARAKFDGVDFAAREVRDSAFKDAEQTFQAEVDKVQEAYDLELAIAQSEAHRAKSEVVALDASMSQHRDIVRQSLGIDLSTLTGLV